LIGGAHSHTTPAHKQQPMYTHTHNTHTRTHTRYTHPPPSPPPTPDPVTPHTATLCRPPRGRGLAHTRTRAERPLAASAGLSEQNKRGYYHSHSVPVCVVITTGAHDAQCIRADPTKHCSRNEQQEKHASSSSGSLQGFLLACRGDEEMPWPVYLQAVLGHRVSVDALDVQTICPPLVYSYLLNRQLSLATPYTPSDPGSAWA